MKRQFRRRTALVMLTAAIMTALTGCGGNDSTSSSAPSETASGSSASEVSETANPLIGQWQAQQVEEAIYTFNEDGTGEYLIMGTVMPLEYQLSDGKITISFKMEGYTPMTLDYDLNGTVLNIKDSFGNDTFYDKKA